jgi:hypothetical protein
VSFMRRLPVSALGVDSLFPNSRIVCVKGA